MTFIPISLFSCSCNPYDQTVVLRSKDFTKVTTARVQKGELIAAESSPPNRHVRYRGPGFLVSLSCDDHCSLKLLLFQCCCI